MKRTIDVEELANTLHNMFKCRFVEIERPAYCIEDYINITLFDYEGTYQEIPYIDSEGFVKSAVIRRQFTLPIKVTDERGKYKNPDPYRFDFGEDFVEEDRKAIKDPEKYFASNSERYLND